MPTFQEFMDTVRDGVEQVGGQLGPEDDWLPMAFLEREDPESTDGVAELTMVGIDPEYMDEEERKEFLGSVVLPSIVEKMKARKYAFLSTAWMAKVGREEDGSVDTSIPPSEHPDRMEVVIITACDREIAEFCYAEIIRTPDHPPMLTPWETMARGIEVEGRFIDSVREVMR